MSVASAASYIIGQCTAYVARVVDWVQPDWGNAAQWPARAKAQGYPVGNTPHIGDVATWKPGQYGAHGEGHVAKVESISNAGITVSEQNWTGGQGVTDFRFVPFFQVQNLQFISPKGTTGVGAANVPNPADAVAGAISGFTTSIQKGAVDLSIYGGFFLLALVLIFVGLLFMVFSTNTGRTAAKEGALILAK